MDGDLLMLRDERAVLLRPVAAGDAPLLGQFFSGLSDESRLRRFHGPRRELSWSELISFTAVDHQSHEAIAAVSLPGPGLVGIAQFMRDETDETVAELALAVADAFQGVGLGTALLMRLAARARTEGIFRFRAQVLQSHRRVLNLARWIGSLGAVQYRSTGVVEAEIHLFPGLPRVSPGPVLTHRPPGGDS